MTPHIKDYFFPVPNQNYKKMVIISSPSGGGKNTLINAILKTNSNLEHSTSTTSRRPRPGEIEGNSYYFVTPEQFQELIQKGEFLEWARVLNNFYGTTYKEIQKIFQKDHIALLDIDVQGAEQIKKFHPEVTTVFIEPPSLKILEERLRRRGTENNDQILQRLKLAEYELTRKNNYDYIIINDTIDRAAKELLEIISLL